MDNKNPTPLLFSFYFGDSANTAHVAASRQLKKWSRAFDQWIDHFKRDSHNGAAKQARLAWRRLVRHIAKMPWRIAPEDIESHLSWLEQESFARSTINPTLGFIRAFYCWCDEHHVDSLCPTRFNPAKEVSRIKYKYFEGICLWTRDEVGAFLDFLKKDGSELGKREFAFFLARINLGVKLIALQHLKWEQIEQDESGVSVVWRPDGEPVRLPDDVWQAIKAYLQASGRLDGMRSGKYIFTLLSRPNSGNTGRKSEDWLEQHELSYSSILANLKIYSRKLGIAEEKLHPMALRHTAIRFKLENGESWVGMKVFMDSRVSLTEMKSRLGRLLELMVERTLDSDRPVVEVQPPRRKANKLTGVEAITHGFFCRKQDRDAVKAVLKENIHGMEEETDCLRKLMRGLLEREGDAARLVEAYSKATQRLGLLVTLDESAKQEKEDTKAEETLAKLDEIEAHFGRPPVSQKIREHVYGISEDGLTVKGGVVEEIATSRLLLRNIYQRVLQNIDAAEYMRLVDLYGMGCVRLARLIKINGGDGGDRLERYLNDIVNEAIRQLNQEWGLDKR